MYQETGQKQLPVFSCYCCVVDGCDPSHPASSTPSICSHPVPSGYIQTSHRLQPNTKEIKLGFCSPAFFHFFFGFVQKYPQFRLRVCSSERDPRSRASVHQRGPRLLQCQHLWMGYQCKFSFVLHPVSPVRSGISSPSCLCVLAQRSLKNS